MATQQGQKAQWQRDGDGVNDQRNGSGDGRRTATVMDGTTAMVTEGSMER